MLLSSILYTCSRNKITISNQILNFNNDNEIYELSKDDRIINFTSKNGIVQCFKQGNYNTSSNPTYFTTIRDAMYYLNPLNEIEVKELIDNNWNKRDNSITVKKIIISHAFKEKELPIIQIRFPEKPDYSIILPLKIKNFKWSKKHNMWFKLYNREDYVWAKKEYYNTIDNNVNLTTQSV